MSPFHAHGPSAVQAHAVNRSCAPVSVPPPVAPSYFLPPQPQPQPVVVQHRHGDRDVDVVPQPQPQPQPLTSVRYVVTSGPEAHGPGPAQYTIIVPASATGHRVDTATAAAVTSEPGTGEEEVESSTPTPSPPLVSPRPPKVRVASWRCRYCSYATYSSNNLQRHERAHTGVKPYACPTCAYRSARSDDLAKHVARHGKDLARGPRTVDCPVVGCGYSTGDHVAYRQHKASHRDARVTPPTDPGAHAAAAMALMAVSPMSPLRTDVLAGGDRCSDGGLAAAVHGTLVDVAAE